MCSLGGLTFPRGITEATCAGSAGLLTNSGRSARTLEGRINVADEMIRKRTVSTEADILNGIDRSRIRLLTGNIGCSTFEWGFLVKVRDIKQNYTRDNNIL
jgi:hypothetical protein